MGAASSLRNSSLRRPAKYHAAKPPAINTKPIRIGAILGGRRLGRATGDWVVGPVTWARRKRGVEGTRIMRVGAAGHHHHSERRRAPTFACSATQNGFSSDGSQNPAGLARVFCSICRNCLTGRVQNPILSPGGISSSDPGHHAAPNLPQAQSWWSAKPEHAFGRTAWSLARVVSVPADAPAFDEPTRGHRLLGNR